MAQADTSGLTQGARKLADTVEGWINKIPTPSKKKDTSWLDSMVKEANESFRKRAEEDKKKVASPAKKATMRRKVTQKPVQKKIATKR